MFKLTNEKEKITKSLSYTNDNGIQPVQESSDVAQTIKELNDDSIDDNNFSSIDMKTRLLNIEISSIIAFDSLVAMGFLPPKSGHITRSKKRLSVSLNGLGRTEIVEISKGIQDTQQGSSMWDRIGNFFGGTPK